MKLPGFLSQNEKLREWLTQFVKFGLVGAVNTLLSLGINYLFIWIDPSLYLWGNFVGWAVSVLNAFYWNNRFVFQKSAGFILIIYSVIRIPFAYYQEHI